MRAADPRCNKALSIGLEFSNREDGLGAPVSFFTGKRGLYLHDCEHRLCRQQLRTIIASQQRRTEVTVINDKVELCRPPTAGVNRFPGRNDESRGEVFTKEVGNRPLATGACDALMVKDASLF